MDVRGCARNILQHKNIDRFTRGTSCGTDYAARHACPAEQYNLFKPVDSQAKWITIPNKNPSKTISFGVVGVPNMRMAIRSPEAVMAPTNNASINS